jgi:hypothetical protein
MLAAAAALSMVGAARAKVTNQGPQGFEVVEQAAIAAPKAKVWAAILAPDKWWSSRHSFSGNAKNLSIDFAKGCFCEVLPNGFVQHMAIIYSDGGTTLRLEGAIGPLSFTGAMGHMSFILKDAPGGATQLSVAYEVGGYAKGGLAETWAAPVDGVLGEAVARLQKYVETGKPE